MKIKKSESMGTYVRKNARTYEKENLGLTTSSVNEHEAEGTIQRSSCTPHIFHHLVEYCCSWTQLRFPRPPRLRLALGWQTLSSDSPIIQNENKISFWVLSKDGK